MNMDKTDLSYYSIIEYLQNCPAQLTKEETERVVARAKAPEGEDMDAYQELVDGHLRYAVGVVVYRYGYTPTAYDIISHVVTRSLQKAASKFDPTKGAAFTTYAYHIIVRDAAEHYFRQNAMVSGISDADRQHSMWVRRRFDAMVQDGYTNNEAMIEVARLFAHQYRTKEYDAMPAAKQRELELQVCELLGLAHHPLSMDRALADPADADYNMLNTMAADECYNPEHIALEAVEPLQVALATALLKLPERVRLMVLMHAGYGQRNEEPRTLEQIGDYFGVSRQYVGKVISRALGFLRDEMSDVI